MGVIRAATLPDLFIGRHYAVAVLVESGLLDYFLKLIRFYFRRSVYYIVTHIVRVV